MWQKVKLSIEAPGILILTLYFYLVFIFGFLKILSSPKEKLIESLIFILFYRKLKIKIVIPPYM